MVDIKSIVDAPEVGVGVEIRIGVVIDPVWITIVEIVVRIIGIISIGGIATKIGIGLGIGDGRGLSITRYICADVTVGVATGQGK